MSFERPDDEYLLQLGQVVYAVAALEAMILFDLDRLPVHPVGLSAEALAGCPTSAIGLRLQDMSNSVTDPDARQWLRAAGAALIELGRKRDALLHTRPARIDGKDRLHQWSIRRQRYEQFPVTDLHLGSFLVEIDRYRATIDTLRLAPTGQEMRDRESSRMTRHDG